MKGWRETKPIYSTIPVPMEHDEKDKTEKTNEAENKIEN